MRVQPQQNHVVWIAKMLKLHDKINLFLNVEVETTCLNMSYKYFLSVNVITLSQMLVLYSPFQTLSNIADMSDKNSVGFKMIWSASLSVLFQPVSSHHHRPGEHQTFISFMWIVGRFRGALIYICRYRYLIDIKMLSIS